MKLTYFFCQAGFPKFQLCVLFSFRFSSVQEQFSSLVIVFSGRTFKIILVRQHSFRTWEFETCFIFQVHFFSLFQKVVLGSGYLSEVLDMSTPGTRVPRRHYLIEILLAGGFEHKQLNPGFLVEPNFCLVFCFCLRFSIQAEVCEKLTWRNFLALRFCTRKLDEKEFARLAFSCMSV